MIYSKKEQMRIFMFLIIFILTLSLAACSSETPQDELTTALTTTSDTQETSAASSENGSSYESVDITHTTEIIPETASESVTSVPSGISRPEVVPNKDKTVYLTFDDGPSKRTPEVLDILDEYNIKATFFVINSQYTSYYKEIVDRGHTIALHTYSHDYAEVYANEDTYFEDLYKIDAVVYKYAGVHSKIIRFPGGSSNTRSKRYSNGLMTKLVSSVQDKGFHYFDWNLDSHDADGGSVAASTIKSYVVNGVSKSTTGTIVVLMHDGGDKKTTVSALPGICKFLKENNIKTDVLTESTPPVHHKVAN